MERIQAAYKRYEAAGAEWVEATLDLARELRAVRQECGDDDRAFGVWLIENELDYWAKDDRAALINIAAHPDVFRDVVEASGRHSLQLIWRELMQPIIRRPTIDAAAPSSPPNPPDAAAPAEDSTPATLMPMASEPVVEREVSLTHVLRTSPLRTYPKAELGLSHMLDATTRKTWGSLTRTPTGRKAWTLLLAAIENGAYGPPSPVSVSQPTLRLLLPWAPLSYAARFSLRKRDDLKLIETTVLPVAMTYRERLQREPDQLRFLIDQQHAEVQRGAEAARLEAKRAALLAQLPRDERPIVIYGESLWPVEFPRWTYAEALHAVWFWQFLLPHLRAMDPQGTEIAVNQTTKWIYPAHDSGWTIAVKQITQAYVQQPAGAIMVPPPPINYRKEVPKR